MKKDVRLSGIRWLFAFLFLFIPLSSLYASVTIIGSRIIYPSDVSSVDVQLKNNDAFPYIVETWFDDGDINVRPQDPRLTPFITTPPVFRIQPKAGQVVRVVFTGKKPLPEDRESVFWFNALQVPPSNLEGTSQQNKMLVMLRTRIKLFYRPTNLGSPRDLGKKLQVNAVHDARHGYGIRLTNPTPWFASVSNIQATVNHAPVELEADMVAPFSSHSFWAPGKKISKPLSGKVTVTLVNDQGARISEDYEVTHN
ncbi:fimbria/pilus periplasmic chaperone [Citrobacter rodentium]|jgi:P pilus assembly protein, chaperone PapD|uniref:Fimbrial chaperone protein n=2 Tax=Citrobacter rodentium TaxID=67825 RepID=D2TJN6_CITRI|nr:fimbria/pilus periplasmic chaperone [Citrobacter rodentium]KIQ51423.1 fimbrial chaperone protein StbB [Citrobacter rodentium]QBY29389.1 fimbrial chaperone [Citrobacter rodentium]UHO33209.1 fimbria/pilus periplasmic chaperone [Citrobacter rodentium NBRC 105723 = DSM 16636]CBG89675.1 putative fimbrial chaperone protein [Citrobacter rodentium ICC168]HAT8015406.1 fimbrial chaperone protein StbB [Citrobacter rodentium NBRC 105723 = DSM 16636]